MKQLLITIAAVLVLGCSESQTTEPPPEPPDISIQAAAGTGNIKAVKQHIASGTDVNAKKRDGYTALQSAARNGHTEVAEFLIEKGADVNAKGLSVGTTGTQVMTALDWAIRRKMTETADLLRKHGAKTGEELKAEGK